MNNLTNEEKINAINLHIKGIDLQMYNAELIVIQESAVGNEERLIELEKEISELNLKKLALVSELEKFI